MNLLQKLFGSSKKESLDASHHFSIDDHPGTQTMAGDQQSSGTKVSFQSSSSVKMVDGNVVRSEISESLSVWGD